MNVSRGCTTPRFVNFVKEMIKIFVVKKKIFILGNCIIKFDRPARKENLSYWWTK